MLEEDTVLVKHYQKILGAALIGIALFSLIAIAGYVPADYPLLLNNDTVRHCAGPVGGWIAYILRSLFGLASYLFVLTLMVPGIFLLRNSWMDRTTEKIILLLLLSLSASGLISLFIRNTPQLSGGHAGAVIGRFLSGLVGATPSYIALSAFVLVIAVLVVVMFLRPTHEHIAVPSRFLGECKSLLSKLPLIGRKRKDSITGKAVGSSEHYETKIPWIIKKRMVVYETEKEGSLFDSLQYPGLPEPDENNELRLLGMEGHRDSTISEQIYCEEVEGGSTADVVLREDDYIINAETESYSTSGDTVDESLYESEEDAIEEVTSVCCEVIAGECFEDEGADRREVFPKEVPITDSVCPADFGERVFDEIPINQEYIIPRTYLTSSKPLDSESWKTEIRKNSVLLKNTLAEFGIEADVVNVNRGPVITLYEMQIAPGIKVNRVVGLADDIAMALAAQRVRIVAPIPGKSAIGVEIPNRYRETVTLGDIIKSDSFESFDGSLVVGLGKDILGNPVMLDLKRLPHLLIAGTTGSGKSVCVNSIITSLLYNYDPNYVRFILIDPKMVELQLYNGLPHLLTPVIVDPQVAPMVLKWTMHEMNRRYCLLSDMNTRDIERYNEKIGRDAKGIEKLPYIVIIIDEMADLMMTSKEVEGLITRIAQKSRAVGIHLVVATQRPSVDIITGIIKANFPARVAFQVAQKTDSRTIIDQNGAEKLLGRGDMLYQSPISSFPIRIQGGFIAEEEIERITSHLCSLGKPSYIDIEESLLAEEDSEEIDGATDELFKEALKIVEETKKASASYLQRRLSIGYNRAARIIEQMEEMGYIGPQVGSKPREVFV